MANFRQQKAELMRACADKSWNALLREHLAAYDAAKAAVSPLLALLPRPNLRWQAAFGLGLAVARMADGHMEDARVIMRRLMWSLNEESGNLGWGVPEAMGCILGESGPLAREYGRILISYGYETGRDDNFLDHAPLRRGVYWGIGRMAAAQVGVALPAVPHLAKALADEDPLIPGMAAFALNELALAAPEASFTEQADAWRGALAALGGPTAQGGAAVTVEYLQGDRIQTATVAELLAAAAQAVQNRLQAAH